MSAFNRSSRPLISQLANQHSTSQPVINHNCDINLSNCQQFHHPVNNRPSINQEAWNPNLFSQPIRTESDIQPTIQPIKTESSNQPYHPTNQYSESANQSYHPTNQKRISHLTVPSNQSVYWISQSILSPNQPVYWISQSTVSSNQSEQNQPISRTTQPIRAESSNQQYHPTNQNRIS